MEHGLVSSFEAILGALARLFAEDGNVLGVSVLAMGESRIEQTSYDNWDGGQYGYTIYFQIPDSLYKQIHDTEAELAEEIGRRANLITPQFQNEKIEGVIISPVLVNDPQWQEKARAFVSGQGISNQGRARSDNLAPRTCDGLLFRSQPEIHLYRALKAAGVTFAPLPVFIRGGDNYRRIEPDFVVLKDGVVLLIEVDGDTVHHESPLEAHNRTTMLVHEGAYLERVNASECDSAEKAKTCASKLLRVIQKLKTNR